MISLAKVQTATNKISQTALEKSCAYIQALNQNPKELVNLNNIPHYKITTPISVAREFLNAFKADFGEIKSATYICEKIKQGIHQGIDDEAYAVLSQKREEYSKHLGKLRKTMWNNKFKGWEEYTDTLAQYIKENGTYINCNEASDLVLRALEKKGIKAQNIFMYTINPQGARVNKAEHVFCLIGLDKNAKINDPSTWGASASICDPWADIALSAKEGIEFYNKFFEINPQKHSLQFTYCPKGYPGV